MTGMGVALPFLQALDAPQDSISSLKERSMKKVQKGFTLIELMIVVAIIGILAAIAIPAYQDYTIRAQVTEGLNLASAVKASVAEFYAQNGSWPTALTGTGNALGYTAKPSGKYVSVVDVTNGTINIKFGGQANSNLSVAANNELDLRPRLSSNGDVVWLCGKHAAPTGITLTDPPAGASATDATTVLDKYLPANCRQ
jgi:type IV pilus assembly protein PilA